MAAKTIQEAVQLGLQSGPLSELQVSVIAHLRDYFAHRVMILGDNATSYELFDDVFSGVPAIRGMTAKSLCKRCDQVFVKDETEMCAECRLEEAEFKKAR